MKGPGRIRTDLGLPKGSFLRDSLRILVGSICSTWEPTEKKAMEVPLENEGGGTLRIGECEALETMWVGKHVTKWQRIMKVQVAATVGFGEQEAA